MFIQSTLSPEEYAEIVGGAVVSSGMTVYMATLRRAVEYLKKHITITDNIKPTLVLFLIHHIREQLSKADFQHSHSEEEIEVVVSLVFLAEFEKKNPDVHKLLCDLYYRDEKTPGWITGVVKKLLLENNW